MNLNKTNLCKTLLSPQLRQASFRGFHLFIFLIFLGFQVSAQKQANIWHFGNKGGLDFNQDPPVPISGAAMNTLEGCASIADRNGKLLFYTDGLSVWNKNHQVMANGTGLKGNSSSTQSAVVLPKPGSKDGFYIFTVDGATGRQNGGYYNEVDMSKNGGLGEIVKKNELLVSASPYRFESIGATSHHNGKDFWVCYLDKDSAIKSFLVTQSGVSTTPVVSKHPNIHGTNTELSFYMKFSSDNKLMAVSYNTSLGLKLFQFDDQTGKFGKPITIRSGRTYGVEFSPNSQFLYTSTGEQYDVSVFDSTRIIRSEYSYSSFSNAWRAIQLGPDGKIYMVNNARARLHLIAEPDKKGSACGFYADSVVIAGTARLGLPTFLQTYLNPDFLVQGTCYGDTARFEITNSGEMDSVKWVFGDSTYFVANISADTFRHGHYYKKPGTYQTASIVFSEGQSDTFFQDLNIRDFLNTGNFLGDDIYKCRGDTVEVGAKDWSFENFIWSNGDSTESTKINKPGKYWVRLFPEFQCFYTDTIEVINYVDDEIPDKLHLGGDLIACPEDTVTLSAKETFDRHVWSTGETTATLKTADSGLFILKGYNHKICFSRDTIHVASHPGAIPDLGPDKESCLIAGQKARVGDVNQAFAKYQWSNGSTDPFVLTDTSGTFILKVENQYGCVGMDTVSVEVGTQKPDIIILGDTMFCNSIPKDSTLAAVNNGDPATFKWNDGSTDSVISITNVGKYVVTAENVCGTDSDSTEVVLVETPTLKLPAGFNAKHCDSVNTTLAPVINGTKPELKWSTGDTTPTILVKKAGIYELIASNGCGADTISAELQMILTPSADAILDTMLCQPVSEIYRLNQSDTTLTYSWEEQGNVLSQADTFIVDKAGTFNLKLENYCGVYRDTFDVHELTVPGVDLGPDLDLCDSIRQVFDISNPGNEETYEWSTAQTVPVIEVRDEGTFWAHVQNKCGESSDTVKIRLHYIIEPVLPLDTILCDQTDLELDATIPGNHSTYSWNHGEKTAKTTIDADGTYEVTIENACMTKTFSASVTFLKTPEVVLQPEYVYCDQAEMTRLESGMENNQETYLWSTGATTNFIEVNEPKKYWLTISNWCGEDSDSSTLRVSISPTVVLVDDTSLCGDVSLELDAGNPGMNYLWTPTGETTQIIVANEQTKYGVTVTNVDGCIGSDEMEINDSCKSRFFIPTAFRPNNDGLNDVFRPTYNANVDQYSMAVYNRWGEQLFFTDDLSVGWDGSYQGEICQTGIYLVVIRYFNHEHSRFDQLNTQVTLFR